MASVNMSSKMSDRREKRISDVLQRKGRFKLIDYSDPNTPVSTDLSVVDDEVQLEQREPVKSACKPKQLWKSPALSPSIFALMELANQVSGSNPNTPVSSLMSVIGKAASNEKIPTLKLKHHRKGSTAITPPIKSALADFTDAQKLSHFNFCMKLSLENKITTKNAFSLHLIDFFSDNVRKEGEPNFQMASLTLDASARIYAVRVDCLHAAAVKMAMGLHANRMGAKDKGDVDKENDTGTSTEQDAAKLKNKKKKKRIFASSTTKSMKIAELEKEEEPHEKFGFIKEIFNAAKCGGLLTSCNVISDKFDISFAEAHVYMHQKRKLDVNYMTDRVVIGATKRILSPVINCDVNINADNGDSCIVPAMESFSFLKESWLHDTSFSGLHADEDSDSSTEEENSAPPVLPSKKMKSSDIEELSGCFINQNNMDFDNWVQDVTLNSLFEQVLVISNDGDSVFDDVNDTFFAAPSTEVRDSVLMPRPKTPPNRCVFGIPEERRTALKSFRNSYLNPPLPCPRMSVQGAIDSLFKMGVDPIVDAALSGRCHMRMKKVVQHIFKKTAGPAKRKRNLRITFEENCEVVNKKTSRGKRNKFTSNYVKKWMTSDTLQTSFSYDETDFFKTFLTELFLNKMAVFEEPGSQLNRSIGYDHVHESSDDEEDANANKPYEAWEVNYEECLSSLKDLKLVPKPEMVKKETVKYSRHSKNIDQKRVKATIWSVISSHFCVDERTQGTDDSDISEKNQKLQSEFENVTPTRCPELTFHRMYKTLLNVLPMSVKEQMSMSIAFVALLHLANEKSLNLEQEEDEFDFRIFMK